MSSSCMHGRINAILLFVVLLIALPYALPGRARAQVDARTAVADRWLDAAVKREPSFDHIGRHTRDWQHLDADEPPS